MITGANCKTAAEAATGETHTVSVPCILPIAIADGATGDIDVTCSQKVRVYDVTIIKRAGAGGASDTITVKNSATAITDAIDINDADKVVSRAATIDDAQYDVSAGGTIRVTRTKASAANVACLVLIHCYRIV